MISLSCPQSDLVKVFVGPGGQPAHEVSRITGVGSKAHGAVAWGSDLIMLDSDSGALVSLDTRTGDVFDLYMVGAVSTVTVPFASQHALLSESTWSLGLCEGDRLAGSK